MSRETCHYEEPVDGLLVMTCSMTTQIGLLYKNTLDKFYYFLPSYLLPTAYCVPSVLTSGKDTLR